MMWGYFNSKGQGSFYQDAYYPGSMK